MVQRLYLWDLNHQKYVRVSNESIHENYVYHQQCVYCVYDTRRRNGKGMVPRCEADVSTRSRFFKHLQSLELTLNRRLICFEEELPVFRLQDLLDKEKTPARKSVDSLEASSTNGSSIASTADPLDIFLQLLANKNQNDHLPTTSYTVDREGDNLANESDNRSESDSSTSTNPASSSNRSDLSNSDTNTEPNENTSSDETSSIISCKSDSLDSPQSPVKKSGPIIKSIKQIEWELNNRNHKKLKTDHEQSDIYNYLVRVSQISEQDEVKFLCYLDEL